MTEKSTATQKEKKATRRSSLSIPDAYGDILYTRYEAENPKRDDGRKMPFGEWLGALAVARLTEKEPSAMRAILPAGGPEVENAAARGAALGVAKSLEGFAGELGKVISERLIEIEERLARMESVLIDGEESL